MKIKISNILIFLLLIPIFQPQLFTQFDFISKIFIIMNLFEFFILFFKNVKSIPKIFIFWIAYRVFLLLSCMLNNNYSGLLNYGYLSLQVSNIILLFNWCYKKNKIQELLLNISILSVILLSINLLTLIIYKNGIIPSNYWRNHDNDYYFLGIKTKIIYYVIPALICSMNLRNKYKKKSILLILFVLSLTNIVFRYTSTGLLFLIFFVIIYCLRDKSNFVPFKYVLYGVVLQISIVFFRSYEIIGFIITNVLNKSLTLSSRVYIWNIAIDYIKNSSIFNILFGNGISSGYAFVRYDGALWQPHSQILELLGSGGIVGTLIFYFFLFYMIKNSSKHHTITNMYKLLLLSSTIIMLSSVELLFTLGICYIPFILIYYLSFERDEKHEK